MVSFVLLLAVCLAAIFWWVLTLLVTVCVLSTPRLPRLSGREKPVQVSVIVPARNEEQRIEQTVRQLLDQEGIDLQIIIVDDRSSDGTWDILARLSAEHPELELVRVEELPSGWLGKCHACSTGAKRATGEWLLFMDGDVHAGDDVISRAVLAAERERADHLTLWPGLNSTGLVTRGCLIAWSQSLLAYAPPVFINRDIGKWAVGVGAFNLISKLAYEAIGGYETLRMEVIDDVKLGRLVRRHGFRQRVFLGVKEVEVAWAQGLWQTILVLEKNWFASVDFSWTKGIGVVFLITSFWVLAALGPILHPIAGSVALGGLLAPTIPAVIQTRFAGWPWYHALPCPLGYLAFVAAGVHSMWKTARQGGIRWRDTFYPLSELRAGLVR